jgi:ABC-type polysaccharide/polyol phosphate transport system ATPase subunit
MLARLGFSIATAWVPEVLILDEVLAVGDARFLKRCRERLEEFRQAGTTVLMVSHALEAVAKNCQRCIWLDQGAIVADGPVNEVLERYESDAAAAEGPSAVGEPVAVAAEVAQK